MEKIFDNPARLESLVKQKFSFPDFIMMENAALAIKQLIEKLAVKPSKCLILCGKGNNGGDGYALARLLGNSCKIFLYRLAEPTADEAKKQYDICKKLKLTFLDDKKVLSFLNNYSPKNDAPLFIIDCLFGTGFHGELPAKAAAIINAANKTTSIRIACDISSGLAFNARYTVTMGEHKLALFGDKAKAVSGQIIVASLGIDRAIFESQQNPAAFLVTCDDVNLPYRTDKASHKGTYGHTAVFAGEKSGAAIICATAAMNFGSGLTSLVQTKDSNLGQFKISPELMICKNGIPAKTNCVVLGPGINTFSENDFTQLSEWFNSSRIQNPSIVLDAGIFDNPLFSKLLNVINAQADSRIVLTPHLLELVRLCKQLKISSSVTTQALASSPELKIAIGKKFNKLYKNAVLVIKSANTFIAAGGQTYIILDGCQSLAKGGSGDVLAGMIASLLSQGYSAKDAAITACETHALISQKIGEKAFNLSPEKIIKEIKNL